jgi:hypothetical protein
MKNTPAVVSRAVNENLFVFEHRVQIALCIEAFRQPALGVNAA